MGGAPRSIRLRQGTHEAFASHFLRWTEQRRREGKKYVYAHFGKKEMEEKGSVIGCVLIFGARRRWRNAVARVMNEVGVGRVTFFVSLSL